MGQQQWSVEEAQSLDVGSVKRLALRIVSGEVDVVASRAVESARVAVQGVEGPPLRVEVDDSGTLNVVHDKLTWGGLLEWITGPHQAKAFVSMSLPAGADVQLGVVDADATVSGIEGTTRVKSVSGEVTLDGCIGEITAETVSGHLESRRLEGKLRFTSVSGLSKFSPNSSFMSITSALISVESAIAIRSRIRFGHSRQAVRQARAWV